MPSSGVYKLVYSWKRKTILRTSPIEVEEKNAHPPFFIVFFNQNRIGNPLYVDSLSDEAILYQFLLFFLQDLIPFLVEGPSLLFMRDSHKINF